MIFVFLFLTYVHLPHCKWPSFIPLPWPSNWSSTSFHPLSIWAPHHYFFCSQKKIYSWPSMLRPLQWSQGDAQTHEHGLQVPSCSLKTLCCPLSLYTLLLSAPSSWTILYTLACWPLSPDLSFKHQLHHH